MKRIKKMKAEYLNEQHLTVLRALGREVGVKSPTEKSKEELIRDIIDIQEGRIEPVEPNKKGAPPKFNVDLSEFFEDDFSATYITQEPNDEIVFHSSVGNDSEMATGILEIHQQGYGFLRVKNYESSNSDIYISQFNIKKYNLRRGDLVECVAKKAPKDGSGSAAFESLVTINGKTMGCYFDRRNFDDLVPCYPDKKIKLETSNNNDIALRCLDLFAPIGFGQRGLIVAPPKTGKTTLLKKIASAIETNYPNAKLFVLLIDERPEEVTDIKSCVHGDVVFSTFDESPEHHIRASELVVNRAKRLMEDGLDVIILMDSITRLTRAYNSCIESSGKTLTGGLDPAAMQGPKRLFGSARNTKKGGSLTIVSTALVETGSRMDDIIYEEFKGTGNMEVYLSRELSERRIFPAIDLKKSGTRKDDLLLSNDELDAQNKLRRVLAERFDATDGLIEMMKRTSTNEELCAKLDSWLKIYNK